MILPNHLPPFHPAARRSHVNASGQLPATGRYADIGRRTASPPIIGGPPTAPDGSALSATGLLPVTPLATSNDPFVDVTVTFPDGSSVVHKARLANAIGNLTTARNIANQINALDSATWGDQIAATRDLYTAIGRFYKDANVIPQSDPLYVQWWREWIDTGTLDGFDSVVPLDFNDPAWTRVNGVGPTAASAMNHTKGIAQRVAQMWSKLGKPPIDANNLFCRYRIRIQLNELGDVITDCVNDQCEFDPTRVAGYVGCAEIDAGRESCADYKWTSLRWHDPPTIGIPAGATCRITDALPPLRWFFEAAIDLLNRLMSRQNIATNNTAVATWLDALQYAALWNVKTARDLNVLPVDLLALSANIPSNQRLDQIAAQQSNINSAMQFSQVAMSIGSMAGPYGTAMAAIVSAIALIFSAVAPGAVATRVDFFGRLMPLGLKADMQGQTVVNPAPPPGTPNTQPPNGSFYYPPPQTMSTGTKVAIGVVAVGAIGALGYAIFGRR